MNNDNATREHLANERTFLAWIRTSIAIIAFGFVIEKFSLFMKQMSLILKQTSPESQVPSYHGYSAWAGIILVCLGTLLSVLGFLKYKKTQRQIDAASYRAASSLDLLLTASIFVTGVFLVVYLIKSLQH